MIQFFWMNDMKFHALFTTVMTGMALTACATQSPTQNQSSSVIEVYQSDLSRQCGGEGLSPEQMQAKLQNITVYGMRKGQLNRAYPSVCGGETGKINIYSIAKKDLAQAQKLGFNILPQE